MKRVDCFFKSVFVVFRAAKQVPTFGVFRIPLEGPREPLVGINVIAKQNVVERDYFQVEGTRCAILCAFGILCQRRLCGCLAEAYVRAACILFLIAFLWCRFLRSCACLHFAKQYVSQQEMTVGGV